MIWHGKKARLRYNWSENTKWCFINRPNISEQKSTKRKSNFRSMRKPWIRWRTNAWNSKQKTVLCCKGNVYWVLQAYEHDCVSNLHMLSPTIALMFLANELIIGPANMFTSDLSWDLLNLIIRECFIVFFLSYKPCIHFWTGWRKDHHPMCQHHGTQVPVWLMPTSSNRNTKTSSHR